MDDDGNRSVQGSQFGGSRRSDRPASSHNSYQRQQPAAAMSQMDDISDRQSVINAME
jgi:hypothetical protein